MDSLFAQLLGFLKTGESVAVATVIATRGATPREAGARMLVRKSGAILGTVGGGCGEAQVWQTALQVLDTGRPQMVPVDLTGEISLDAEALCGGTMEVLVERWGGEEGSSTWLRDTEVASALVERCRQRHPSVLATVLTASHGFLCQPGDHAVVGTEGLVLGGLGSSGLDEWLAREATEALQSGGFILATYPPSPSGRAADGSRPRMRLSLEVVTPPPLLAVVGAGHIAVPLTRMAKLLGFEVAVLDDRASFANVERFPEADAVLAAGFPEGLRQLPLGPDSYVVLVTRGHQHDLECLRKLVEIPMAYLGMIGSQRRVSAVFDLLRREGVPAERLGSVHAPIGVDLGAQTPAEIAVSILAEIVKVRRGGRALSLSERRRE